MAKKTLRKKTFHVLIDPTVITAGGMIIKARWLDSCPQEETEVNIFCRNFILEVKVDGESRTVRILEDGNELFSHEGTVNTRNFSTTFEV